jgi:hypothetical protein
MATANLGLKNDFATLDLLPESWLNSVASQLDLALRAGLLSRSVAGSADVTLTGPEWDHLVLEFTGVLSASISVILPATAGRAWLVLNNTSGVFSLTVRSALGSGVTVAQGARALLYGNGSDIVRAGADVTATGVVAANIGPSAAQQHVLPAVSADTVALLSAAQTLTGKTLATPRLTTALLDANGNELLSAAVVASAVNQLEARNAASGNSPRLAAIGDDTNVGLELTPKGSGVVSVSGPLSITGALDHDGATVGFYGVTPIARPAAYTQSYATADRTLAAYSPDAETSPYTGHDNAQAGTVYAKVADLNALRTAYENLRALTEDLTQMVNATVDDLQALGLVQ